MATIIEKRVPLDPPFKFFKDISKSVFFDIETTGLNRYSCMCYLIGIMTLDGDELVIEQFFADRPEEEGEILEAFLDRIEGFEELLSFNGDAFDIPFVNERMKQAGVVDRLNHRSLDLLKVVRRHKHKLDLPNLRLKTLEEYAGVFREDQLSGREMIPLYYSYVNRGDEDAKESILLHNFEDILNMKVLDTIMDKIYNINSITTQEGNRISLIHYTVSRNSLIMECEISSPVGDVYIDESGDTLSIDGSMVSIKLNVTENTIQDKKILVADKKEKFFLQRINNQNPPYIPDDLIILAVNQSYNVKIFPYIAYAFILHSLIK